MPWHLLPGFALVQYATPRFGILHLDLRLLFVALAVYGAVRHGAPGVAMAAIGAAPFLAGFGGPYGYFGGSIGTVIAGLLAASLAATARSDAPWPDPLPRHWWMPAVVALALLPAILIQLPVGRMVTGSGAPPIGFGFQAPVMVMLLWLGAAGVRRWPFALALAVAIPLSFALVSTGLARDEFIVINPIQVSTALAALAALSLGGFIGRSRASLPEPAYSPWRRPAVTILLLMVLWSGIEGISRIELPGIRPVYWLGHWLALPLAAFAAGFIMDRRGIAYAVGLSVLLPAFNLGLAILFDDTRFIQLQLEAPLLALAFGFVGRAARRGHVFERPPAEGSRFLGYLAMVLVALPVLFDLKDVPGLVSAAVFIAISVGIYVFAAHLQRLTAGTPYEITPARWLGFVALLLALAGVVENIDKIVSDLRQLPVIVAMLEEMDDALLDDEDMAFAAAFVLAYLGVAAGIVVGAARTVPKVVGDARNIVLWLRSRSGGGLQPTGTT